MAACTSFLFPEERVQKSHLGYQGRASNNLTATANPGTWCVESRHPHVNVNISLTFSFILGALYVRAVRMFLSQHPVLAPPAFLRSLCRRYLGLTPSHPTVDTVTDDVGRLPTTWLVQQLPERSRTHLQWLLELLSLTSCAM